MSRPAWRTAPVLLLLAALAALPAPADAQLGALKRKAQQAARNALEDQLPFTPMEAPEFNDRVLEITPSLLTQLLRGFEAEAAYAKTAGKEYDEQVSAHERALKDYEKAQEAYGKDSEKWEACSTAFMEKEVAASAANDAKIDKAFEDMNDEEFEKYLEDLAVRGEKLAREIESGTSNAATQKAWQDYQRELQVVVLEQQRRGLQAMAAGMAEQRRAATEDPRLVEACGKRPETPVQPTSPLGGPEGVLAAKGAEAADMRAEQYAIMRERVLYWWEQDRRPARMGYTQGEIDLLGERADDVEEAFQKMKKARVPL